MRMRVMSTNCRDTSAFPDFDTTLAARMTCKVSQRAYLSPRTPTDQSHEQSAMHFLTILSLS